MVLEAIEDDLRGWRGENVPLGEERVARGRLHIEHVMPRKWELHWPLSAGLRSDERDRLIHTVGNLTLLTGRLNSKVSNGPWLGSDGKRHGLESHDVLMLNRELLKGSDSAWTDADIRRRSDALASRIIEIWPVPDGHSSGFAHEKATARHRVDVADLLSAGLLEAGRQLFARRKQYADLEITVLADGRIDVAGEVYATPSHAARTITGRPTNGWWFFLVDRQPRRELRDVRRDYLESFAEDVDDEDGEDEEEDGDDS
jgi:hypothetical protein